MYIWHGDHLVMYILLLHKKKDITGKINNNGKNSLHRKHVSINTCALNYIVD